MHLCQAIGAVWRNIEAPDKFSWTCSASGQYSAPLGVQKPLLNLAEIVDGKMHLEELGTTWVQDLCMAGNAIQVLDVGPARTAWSARRALPLLHVLARPR